MNNFKHVECNSYIKVYLEPVKASKQQTELARGNRNPTYNSVHTFKNVSKEDLSKYAVRLKVCNKIGSAVSLYNKKSTIGEIILPLADLNLESVEEYRAWHDLDDVAESQV